MVVLGDYSGGEEFLEHSDRVATSLLSWSVTMLVQTKPLLQSQHESIAQTLCTVRNTSDNQRPWSCVYAVCIWQWTKYMQIHTT